MCVCVCYNVYVYTCSYIKTSCQQWLHLVITNKPIYTLVNCN